MTDNPRPAVSASARQSRAHDESEDNLFEQQNEALLNQLGGKVSSLKSLSITIGDSIKSSNKDLDDLSNDFGKTGALFGGVMNRFGKMLEAGGAKNISLLQPGCSLDLILPAWESGAGAQTVD